MSVVRRRTSPRMLKDPMLLVVKVSSTITLPPTSEYKYVSYCLVGGGGGGGGAGYTRYLNSIGGYGGGGASGQLLYLLNNSNVSGSLRCVVGTGGTGGTGGVGTTQAETGAVGGTTYLGYSSSNGANGGAGGIGGYANYKSTVTGRRGEGGDGANGGGGAGRGAAENTSSERHGDVGAAISGSYKGSYYVVPVSAGGLPVTTGTPIGGYGGYSLTDSVFSSSIRAKLQEIFGLTFQTSSVPGTKYGAGSGSRIVNSYGAGGKGGETNNKDSTPGKDGEPGEDGVILIYLHNKPI